MREPPSNQPSHHPPRSPRPRKRFGQHFLRDPRILERIADAAQLSPADTVIEVGPGRGALTDHLRARAARVVAIEIDRDLCAALRARYEGDARVSVVEGDVLDANLAALAGGPFTLVGNVPYYITTPIIFHALEAPRPRCAVFLVQREVAERLGASPGSKTYGALSVNVQALAKVETLFSVSAGAFHPPPKVESAVVRITPLAQPLVASELERSFQAFVRAAFGLRRKQMRRALRTILGTGIDPVDDLLERAGLGGEERLEDLTVERIVRLHREVERGRSAPAP